MGIGEVLAIVVITLFIGVLFFYGFKRRGPWGSLWTFLLVLFLGLLVANIWITPVGPIWWGGAWIDLLFVGILFALLLAAATPPTPRTTRTVDFKESGDIEPAPNGALAVVGLLFWIMVTFFVAIILVGLFM